VGRLERNIDPQALATALAKAKPHRHASWRDPQPQPQPQPPLPPKRTKWPTAAYAERRRQKAARAAARTA